MKKRSLFAAVAMLIVSAVVLTSATYAWFQASHEATVAKVTAVASGADAGSVQVSANSSSGWTTSLSAADLGYSADVTLDPADVNPASSMSNIYAMDFDGTNYTRGNGSILQYTWYVRSLHAESGKSITIPVSFSSGTCIYGAIAVDGTLVTNGGSTAVWGPASDSYVSLGTCTAATDGNSGTAGIVESGEETTGSLGATVTVNSVASITAAADGSAHTITVYVWAAGQDSDCVGSVSISDAGFTFGTTGANQGIRLT